MNTEIKAITNEKLTKIERMRIVKQNLAFKK